MTVTLLIIYTIGFGNVAVLTEKFHDLPSCQRVLSLTTKSLGKAVKTGECT